MTMIILEGTDANFKTTISEKLSSELGFKVEKGSTFEYATSGNDALNKRMVLFSKMDDVILDRYIYSNLVYAAHKTDYSILTEDQVENIESIIREKAIVVYLKAPHEVLIERIGIRGDEYIKSEELAGINAKYEEVMKDRNVYVVEYDTSKQNSDEIVFDIINQLDLENKSSW